MPRTALSHDTCWVECGECCICYEGHILDFLNFRVDRPAASSFKDGGWQNMFFSPYFFHSHVARKTMNHPRRLTLEMASCSIFFHSLRPQEDVFSHQDAEAGELRSTSIWVYSSTMGALGRYTMFLQEPSNGQFVGPVYWVNGLPPYRPRVQSWERDLSLR